MSIVKEKQYEHDKQAACIRTQQTLNDFKMCFIK